MRRILIVLSYTALLSSIFDNFFSNNSSFLKECLFIFKSFFLDPDLWFPSLTPRWKRPFCALPLGPDRVKEPNFFYLESSLWSTGHISPKPQKEKDKTAQSWIPNVVFLFQPVQTTASSIILKLLKNSHTETHPEWIVLLRLVNNTRSNVWGKNDGQIPNVIRLFML